MMLLQLMLRLHHRKRILLLYSSPKGPVMRRNMHRLTLSKNFILFLIITASPFQNLISAC